MRANKKCLTIASGSRFHFIKVSMKVLQRRLSSRARLKKRRRQDLSSTRRIGKSR